MVLKRSSKCSQSLQVVIKGSSNSLKGPQPIERPEDPWDAQSASVRPGPNMDVPWTSDIRLPQYVLNTSVRTGPNMDVPWAFDIRRHQDVLDRLPCIGFGPWFRWVFKGFGYSPMGNKNKKEDVIIEGNESLMHQCHIMRIITR